MHIWTKLDVLELPRRQSGGHEFPSHRDRALRTARRARTQRKGDAAASCPPFIESVSPCLSYRLGQRSFHLQHIYLLSELVICTPVPVCSSMIQTPVLGQARNRPGRVHTGPTSPRLAPAAHASIRRLVCCPGAPQYTASAPPYAPQLVQGHVPPPAPRTRSRTRSWGTRSEPHTERRPALLAAVGPPRDHVATHSGGGVQWLRYPPREAPPSPPPPGSRGHTDWKRPKGANNAI